MTHHDLHSLTFGPEDLQRLTSEQVLAAFRTYDAEVAELPTPVSGLAPIALTATLHAMCDDDVDPPTLDQNYLHCGDDTVIDSECPTRCYKVGGVR